MREISVSVNHGDAENIVRARVVAIKIRLVTLMRVVSVDILILALNLAEENGQQALPKSYVGMGVLHALLIKDTCVDSQGNSIAPSQPLSGHCGLPC